MARAWTKLTIYAADPSDMAFAVRAHAAAVASDKLDSSLYGFVYGEDIETAVKVTLRVNKAGCSAWVYR